MKVVPLATSILAATLATASTILLITNRNERLRSEAEMNQAKAESAVLHKNLAQANTQITEQNGHFTELGARLQDTVAKLDAKEQKVAQLESQLLQARSQLTLREETENLLNRENGSQKKEISALQGRLVEMELLRARVNQLEQSIALSRTQIGPDGRAIKASAEQTPSAILAVGADNAFIVINIGSKGGSAKNSRVLIRRGTEFIGSALISEVFEDLSLAQVDPHALREALHTGDGIVLSQ